MTNADHQSPGDNVYKMRAISALTGFSPTLLRAWERRFDFLSPSRLPGGHRLYTEQDLKVLNRVKELLDTGHAIGAVAALGRDRLLSCESQSQAEQQELARLVEQLAPIDLQSYRAIRYGGEGLSVSLADLEFEDLAIISRLYKLLTGVYSLWLYLDEAVRDEQLLRERLSALGGKDFRVDISRLGAGKTHYPQLVRAALEDSKRGALIPLLQHFDKLQQGGGDIRTCVLLARDQAKILRNAFHDIDHDLRPADESPKAHAVEGMVCKIEDILPHYEAILDWDGAVSSRCLETSAVDRVLYDFVRRIEALGSTSTTLWVGPINAHLTRWAFRFDGKGFQAHVSEDLPVLAVSMSIGLTPQAALDQGYLGSKEGWAWFHWPVFQVPAGATLCSCDL